jgi:ligand-binding sensor domain-containing protein/signal transduction histidine kinase
VSFRLYTIVSTLTALLLWACSWIVVAQGAAEAVPAISDDYLLRRWDMDEGLPQSSVSDIVQTPDGYLWLGTRDSLVRFDGVRFKAFRSFDATMPFVADVRCLTTDANGALWAGFERSAAVRVKSGKFELMAPPGGFSERTYALTADGSGGVWAGYSEARLGHWRNGDWEMMDLNPDDKQTRFRDNVVCRTDSEKRVWFASEWMVGYIKGNSPVMLRQNSQLFFQLTPRRKGGVWLTAGRKLQIATADGIQAPVADLGDLGVGVGGEIQTLMEDRQGAVWIGTKGRGLFRYFEGQVLQVPTSHNYIRALCEDREGNLWVGTGGSGLNRLRLRNIRLHDRSNDLPKDLIVSLCEATDGSVWLAPSEAAPVQLGPDRQVLPLAKNRDMLSGVTLCKDHSGGVWLGSYDRGVFRLREGRFELVGLKNKQIGSILEDSHGTLWVGTLNDGIFAIRDGQIKHYPVTEKLNQISALAEDSSGCLWVATFSGTLHQRVNDSFVLKSEMLGLSIITILPDGPGRIWIGTRGGGLFRFKDGGIKQVAHGQGLADDDVRQILIDDTGGMWIGSAHGLFKVQRSDVEAVMDGEAARFECAIYGRNEGLGNIEFSEGFRNAACRTSDGKLWFATSRGAVEATPEKRAPKPPPIMHIEELLVDGEPLAMGDPENPVIVPAGSRSVELRYTGLSFASPENVQFRHRLEDVESEWLKADTERSATYFRLPPGKYRFYVTARVAGGDWQPDGSTVSFVVLPTLWQNTYFRALLVVLLLALATAVTRAILLRRMRTRVRALEQSQALSNERRRIARDMHDELGAGLTRIELMGNQALRNPGLDPDVTVHVGRITDAAREVVQTLDQIVWTVNPGNDRLDRVIGYLSQYVSEFLAPTKIQFRQELPESVPPITITSQVRHELLLALKEALNNAVKHSGAAEITLNVSLDHHVLSIILADNGHGFDPATMKPGGDGLDNLRQRLSLIGGQCRTESVIGKGSVVSITLPFPGTKAS